MSAKRAPKARPQMAAHHGGTPDPEYNSGIPIEIPLSCKTPMPLQQMIAQFVRNEVEKEKHDEFESFEEANDFEDDDEDALLDMTPYVLADLEPDPGGLEEPPEAPEAPVTDDQSEPKGTPAPEPESRPVDSG